MYKRWFKRFLDFVVSFLLILIFSPIVLLSIFLVFLTNFSNPMFIQLRPGLKQKMYKILKISTMNSKKNSNGFLLDDHQRLTRLGFFLRAFSIDELPQLINVLKGDMSLVGPRPLLVEYLPLYNEHQKRRHEVKPGITGWAQVNGRNAISWQEKFDLDVWYVDHCSFSLDMKILWLTILKVFKREGINQAGQATVEKFNGHN
jgi:lipopolysaccharide/colanic/teichoic acid biosynthesis glycosyltransferase